MASSGFRSCTDEDYNAERLLKGPLEYVVETKEYICGYCGQVLIPNRTNLTPEAHFKNCENSKENRLLMIFKDLRKVQQNLQVLRAEICEMKEKMDTVQTEMKADLLNMKTEFKNDILALKAKSEERNDVTLFSKVRVLEEQIREMGAAQDTKIAEVNGRVSGVTETISTVVHSIIQELKGKDVTSSSTGTDELERVKSNDGDVQVIKRRVKIEREDSESTKRPKSAHEEPSPQMTILMNCFNLVTHAYPFQPSFKWTIDGIRNKMERKMFTETSEMFQWRGYPVQARAKLQLKEDDDVYLSLCLISVQQVEGLVVIPQVFYLLKDQSGGGNARHKCKSTCYLSGSAFTASSTFDLCFGHKNWLKNSPFNVNDSIEMEIYVEPSPMTQHVHSYDGTLDWKIENYTRRLQLEKGTLVLYQESPYFYTGPKGYRVQVKIRLNGVAGEKLTARVSFLTGEFDAELAKSFSHSTTVTLMNRKEAERSISKSIVDDIKNKKYDDFEMCKVEEVKNFVENDALFCKVSIQSH